MPLNLSLGLSLGSIPMSAPASQALAIIGILGADLLALWDAQEAASLSLSGATVTEWRDLLHGYAAAPASTNERPSISYASFNGFNEIIADGSDDNLTFNAIPFPSGASPSELWAAVSQSALAADATSRVAMMYGGSSTTTGRLLRRVVSAGANRGGAQIGNGSATTAITGSTDLSARHVLNVQVGATTSTFVQDGAATGPTAVTPNTSTTRLRFFATTATTPGAFWQGGMSLALITNALSAEKRAALTTILNARRG